MQIGIFGKMPATGDFVAHNAGSPALRAFQDWMQGEVDHLSRVNRTLGPTPIRFLYRDGAGQGACIGAFVPSRDQVGRRFPLAVFVSLDVASAAAEFPGLPSGFDPFLDQVGVLFGQAETMDVASFVERATAIALPEQRELVDAMTWTHQALEATAGQTILEALFGPLTGGVQYHGLHMFLTACAQVRGTDTGTAGITLECPASDDVQLAFWLRLAHRLLQWRNAPPSLFWTDVMSPDSRLLLALGAPPKGILHFLADPMARAERLWPMRTSAPASIEAGRQALGPQRRVALEPPAPTAAALLAALVGH